MTVYCQSQASRISTQHFTDTVEQAIGKINYCGFLTINPHKHKPRNIISVTRNDTSAIAKPTTGPILRWPYQPFQQQRSSAERSI